MQTFHIENRPEHELIALWAHRVALRKQLGTKKWSIVERLILDEFGGDKKVLNSAGRRYLEHLKKLDATGHGPNIYRSSKFIGEPTQWQQELDEEYKAFRKGAKE